MPYLAFNLNNGHEFIFEIIEERLSVGRNAKNNVVIDKAYISSFHAELIRDEKGSYELVDLKSANGTFVNGSKIERSLIKDGDQLRFGPLEAKFRHGDGSNHVKSDELKSLGPKESLNADNKQFDTHILNPASDVAIVVGSLDPSVFQGSSVTPVKEVVAVKIVEEQGDHKLEEASGIALITARQEQLERLDKQIVEREKSVTAIGEKLADLKTLLSSSEVVAGELASLERHVQNKSEELKALEERSKGLTERVETLTQTEARIQQLQEEIKAAEIRKTELTGLTQQMAQEGEGLSQALLTAIEKGKAQHSLNQTLAQQQESLGKEIRASEAQKAELTIAVQSLQDKQQEVDKTLAEKTAALSKLEAQVREAGQQKEELDRDVLALQGQISGARSELEQIQKSGADQMLADESASAAAKKELSQITEKVQSEQARLTELEQRLEKASAAASEAESKKTEAEQAATQARDEEKNLRKQIPALQTEFTELQSSVANLAKERDESVQFVTRLNATTESSNRKIAELQQQISQLEAAHQMREERLMNAEKEMDKESLRLKAAQEASRQAEQTLADMEKEVRESRQKADASRTQATGLETELNTRMDRIEKLKMEETRLIKAVELHEAQIQAAKASFTDLQDKIRAEEMRLGEFIQSGGQILSLGDALNGLRSCQKEIEKSLREASENELALQVKISALRELLNRESARVEQVKKERQSQETDLQKFTERVEKQTADLQAQEENHHRRLTDLETQLRTEAEAVEKLKNELKSLSVRVAEFSQTEAQLQQWVEIEARMRGQLLELEEKHDLLRQGLPVEESMVVMFANDIIKRLDLVDALSSRYAEREKEEVVDQLRTLRQSFEDILMQHGISEFDVDPGTELDLELRQRITVVDSIPGKNKPCVVESCRSGFIYSREEGHELILRKVEVKTSSQ